ncbi:hypothetical protein CBL_08514 [Carabus blaptoides fortunei]
MLISTLHKDAAIDKESGDAQKAELLIFCNMTKDGVDTNDKLCATYNVGRRTRRWPVAIFFHLINVCAINALVIYNFGNNGNPLNRREFLKKLGRELAEPFQRERMDDPHISRNIKKRLYTHFDEETVVEPPAAAVPKTKKRCHICPKSKNKANGELSFLLPHFAATKGENSLGRDLYSSQSPVPCKEHESNSEVLWEDNVNEVVAVELTQYAELGQNKETPEGAVESTPRKRRISERAIRQNF